MKEVVFKALADPTRRRILRMIADREVTAGEIAKQFDITAPSMSHHFNILKQADLVHARRKGQQIFYSLNTTVFQDVIGALMDIFQSEERNKE
jgi:ArsR family transcriptional regulator, arsenate/arsenite/antimonite-responsive transcriptional repressor